MVLSLNSLALERKGKSIFSGLSLSLDRGEFLHVLAPNGTGKTSLLRVLSGSLAPTRGRCQVEGFDIVSSREKALSHIGFVPSDAPFWAGYTVLGQLLAYARLKGLDKRAAIERSQELIEGLDLAPYAQSPAIRLSGGYRKRLALALALVHRPSLLLLDELSAGLDPDWQKSFASLVRELSPLSATLSASNRLEEALCGDVLFLSPQRGPVFLSRKENSGLTDLEAAWRRAFSVNGEGSL